MEHDDSRAGRSRLSEPAGQEPIEPFVLAEKLTRCELYWLPCSLPAKDGERKWTLQFLALLQKRLALERELKPELFVEAEAVYPDRQELLIQTSLDFNPVLGFSRTPGGALPSIPTTESVDSIRRQEKPFDLKPFTRGICFWFLFKKAQMQLESFWGFGGMTMLLIKPDPAAKAPAFEIPNGIKKHPAFQAAFQQNDLQGKLEAASSLQSSFLKKSKEHFGKGWEDRLEYRGTLYVLPRWKSEDFFTLPEEEIKHLFEICEMFITESPGDQGILLASAKPVRAVIHEIVKQLNEAGTVFPK